MISYKFYYWGPLLFNTHIEKENLNKIKKLCKKDLKKFLILKMINKRILRANNPSLSILLLSLSNILLDGYEQMVYSLSLIILLIIYRI